MPRLRSLAAAILCASLAAPAAAVAEPIVRGDVQIKVDLPRIIIRDRDRTPPRGYIRFENYDAYDRYDRDRVTYDIGGAYDSRYGRVFLEQHGARVTGTFDGGMLKGRIRGNTLQFRWQDSSGAEGRGVFYLNRSNRLSGTWGTFNSVNNAGSWDLRPVGVSRWDRDRDRHRDRDRYRHRRY